MPQTPFYIRRILLVEDDADDREFFRDALSAIRPDISLIAAENGLLALDVLKSGQLPDLVFLDLNMPLKNGYECLEAVKEDSRLKHLPVVICSTSLQPESAQSVYELGASLYLVKPNSYQTLKASLKYVLDMAQELYHGKTTREHFILQL